MSRLLHTAAMDNVDLQVLRQAERWLHDGQRAVLGTITSTWGSAPRPAGSLVALRGDGQVAGSVSGGCIEDDLIERVRSGDLATLARPVVVRYGVEAEQAARFGLPCGGTIELVLEPLGAASALPELLARLQAGTRVRRTLGMARGTVTLEDAGASDVLSLDSERLVTTLGPRYRLFVVGAGQMTHYLAWMARALDYEVTVCDPRQEYAADFAVEGVQLVREMPDDAVRALAPDGHTAIIALTHDPKLDDLALLEALASPAFYVGAIGSRANQAKRKARLAEHFGVAPAALERLRGPVGLKNGARTPPEIAVAILAELTAARYGYTIPEPAPPATPAPRVGCISQAG